MCLCQRSMAARSRAEGDGPLAVTAGTGMGSMGGVGEPVGTTPFTVTPVRVAATSETDCTPNTYRWLAVDASNCRHRSAFPEITTCWPTFRLRKLAGATGWLTGVLLCVPT